MFRSNFLKTALCLSIFSIFAISCSRDDDNVIPPTGVALDMKTQNNLFAPQTGGQGQPTGGQFTKFNFSQNAVVTNDSWDIAFRGTTILVNGGANVGITDEPNRTGNAGAMVVTNTFNELKSVPTAATFLQDGASSYAINSWYNYNPTTHVISPIPGNIYVIRTHDNKYAKMEIVSYYKDAPANPDGLTTPSRYYTFKFVYQANGTTF